MLANIRHGQKAPAHQYKRPRRIDRSVRHPIWRL